MSETDRSLEPLCMFAISRKFDFFRRVRNELKFAKKLPLRRNITKNNTLCAVCDTELRTLKFRVRSWPAPCPVSSTFPDMSEIDRIFRCPDVTGQGGLGFFRPPLPEFEKVVEKSRSRLRLFSTGFGCFRPASAFFDHLLPWRREVRISHVQVQKNSRK